MRNQTRGFTLIELLLVVVIIGLSLAVIVPRAWRANVDTKYGLVRQAASELASFGMEWAEGQLAAQAETSTSTMNSYLQTLAGNGAAVWVGRNAASNWNDNAGVVNITGRAPTAPETSVQGIVPPEKSIRNPFNGAAYFTSGNDGSTAVVPGALGAAYAADGTWSYYAFVFHGTDSAAVTDFYAGQDDGTLPGLRNGVFFARTR